MSAGAANIGQIIIKANRRSDQDNVSRIGNHRKKDKNKDKDKDKPGADQSKANSAESRIKEQIKIHLKSTLKPSETEVARLKATDRIGLDI